MFNLVYETNVASCRIWDALGFKRIGRVKGCGNLRSYPDEFVDAIIYGRELGPEGEDYVAEERFDKIRFYLKNGKYPVGADRAEKSRLRSAATHYKLLPPMLSHEEERLMLKDKEVISDPQKQYEIARTLHMQSHGGINKTTATVAERYHWVRIKDTVSMVIKNCPDCKETNKVANARAEANQANNSRRVNNGSNTIDPAHDNVRTLNFNDTEKSKRNNKSTSRNEHHDSQLHNNLPHHESFAHVSGDVPLYDGLPLDPQIMHYDPTGLDNTVQSSDNLLHGERYDADGDHSMNDSELVTSEEVEDLEHQLLNTSSFSNTV